MIIFEQCFQFLEHYIVNYIDIDYSLWLTWFLTPVLVTFILPAFLAVFIYITVFVLYIHKLHWNRLKTSLLTDEKWQAARKLIAVGWDAHGWIWHGYEIQGLENLPENGPALIIYYHGAIPIDLFYFLAKIFILRNKIIHTVAAYFLFKFSGFSILADCFKVIPGTIQSCSKLLKDGNFLAISPGGVYEAQFSTNYDLLWKKRLGFAKVAINSKVPVIPMFTENVRESFRAVSLGRRLFLKLYAWTKFPFAPIYGGFPVKMITHIGKPIYCDPKMSPEELQEKVATAIENLIKDHQRLPGNILLSLMDRIPYLKKKMRENTSKHKN